MTAGHTERAHSSRGGWRVSDEPPLTGRSVIASTLLGMRPPRLRTSSLVASCGLFGISEGTARVAISRMTAAGELTADDGGYRLAGALLSRQLRQQLSRAGTTRVWRPGRDPWRSAVVIAEGRSAADRAALRRAAAALRLGPLREGSWLRPDNLAAGTLPDAEAAVAGQCLTGRLHPDGDEATLAARLWHLEAWAGRTRRLVAAVGDRQPRLAAGDLNALPEAFVLSAAILRHLQADPLLPVDLLPAEWPGAELRDADAGYAAAFQAVWRAWYRAQG